MHVLLTNDDGPLDDKSCPYMKYFVDELRRSTDWKLSIVVPDQQRSWIGKAHFAGKSLTVKYIYTKDSTTENDADINKFLGPFDLRQNFGPEYQEWYLVDSTPAACADIGLHHLAESEPVDLVISGPNFGKNSGNLYILASGTVGAAMEAVTHGTKAIALSYEFRSLDHDFDTLREAARISVDLVSHLKNELDARANVDLFSVNVPLIPSLKHGQTKIMYAPLLNNKWESIYAATGENQFAWAPDFKLVWNKSILDQTHTDSRVLHDDGISVTPLQATFKAVEPLQGEIVLKPKSQSLDRNQDYLLVTIPEASYIYEPLTRAFREVGFQITTDKSILETMQEDPSVRVFHYGEYEDLDLDLVMSHIKQLLVPSYIYRKALIRKNYLANTVRHYVAKNPDSCLKKAIPETHQLEVDYAEFLDDALDDAYELRDEIENGEKMWILKPAMSDKGQGIRLFRTVDELQAIFDSFEVDSDAEDEAAADADNNGVIISQLRHFVVQEYHSEPLLLPAYDNRKFHLRVYVVSCGDLKVFVYEKILLLFAEVSYAPDDVEALAAHLTNTCLQEGKDPLVVPFWGLEGLEAGDKCKIFEQVKAITGDLFRAASSVDKINFQPLPNAIEVFGVDFIVDLDFSVSLLEVNLYPDFKQTGHLKEIIDDLFTQFAGLVPSFGEDSDATPLLHQVHP